MKLKTIIKLVGHFVFEKEQNTKKDQGIHSKGQMARSNWIWIYIYIYKHKKKVQNLDKTYKRKYNNAKIT